VRQCQVVVATVDAPAQLLHLSQLCRAAQVPLVVAHARGWFVSVFADFGESWESAAPAGDASLTCLVESLTRDYPAAVTVVDEQRHNLATGACSQCVAFAGSECVSVCGPQCVAFAGSVPAQLSGVGHAAGDAVVFEGCGADSVLGLDDDAPRTVTVTGPYSFTLDTVDTRHTATPPAEAPAGYIRTVSPESNEGSAGVFEGRSQIIRRARVDRHTGRCSWRAFFPSPPGSPLQTRGPCAEPTARTASRQLHSPTPASSRAKTAWAGDVRWVCSRGGWTGTPPQAACRLPTS
jgi:hypothetical protein